MDLLIKPVVVLFCALAISSCSDYGYREIGPERIDEMNHIISEAEVGNEEWTDSLPLIIEQFSGYAGGSLEIEERLPDGTIMIFYAVRNLMDDSVYGYKIKAQLKLKDGTWQIIKAKEAWKCQGDRGHQYYGHSRCS